MLIFLSYAREERPLALELASALHASGFETFLDAHALPPGQEFHGRIHDAVRKADLFVFLASPQAVEPGSYALTELQFAEQKWRNPSGFVLPVLVSGLDGRKLPAYLQPINAMSPKGNVVAEVVGWVRARTDAGGGGAVSDTPRDRLLRFSRLTQPPLRRRRVVPGAAVARFGCSSVFMVVVALFVVVALGFMSEQARAGVPGGRQAQGFLNTFMLLFGAAGFVIGAAALFRALASARAVLAGFAGMGAEPAIILERSDGAMTLETLKRGRVRLASDISGTEAHPGDIGWAFIAAGRLYRFDRARSETTGG